MKKNYLIVWNTFAVTLDPGLKSNAISRNDNRSQSSLEYEGFVMRMKSSSRDDEDDDSR